MRLTPRREGKLIDMRLTKLRQLCVEWAYMKYRHKNRSRWALRQIALKRYRKALAERLARSTNTHPRLWLLTGWQRTGGRWYNAVLEDMTAAKDQEFFKLLDEAVAAEVDARVIQEQL